MPRLHYYFYGAAIAGGLYGIVYKRLYLPYTTHQREMELVLEAEKFVSQQLLQKAERLNRQVGVAPVRELPSLVATAYALYNEFEQSDCQSSALPKSLYVSRLKSIRERCGLLPLGQFFNEETGQYYSSSSSSALDFTFSQQVRIAAAYSIFYIMYHLSSFITNFIVLPSPTLQRIGGDVILKLLNLSSTKSTIKISSLQEEDAERKKRQDNELADAVNKDKVFEYKTPRDLEEELKRRPKRRDDEITLDDDYNIDHGNAKEKQQLERNVVNIAHVSHWIEEFLVRYAVNTRKVQIMNYSTKQKKYTSSFEEDLSKERLVIRYFDPNEKKITSEPTQPQKPEKQQQQSSSQQNDSSVAEQQQSSSSTSILFNTPFLCYGYPWFDQEFVDRVVEDREKESTSSLSKSSNHDDQNDIVLIRPITVTRGLNKILFPPLSNKEKNSIISISKDKSKKTVATKRVKELSAEEQLALAEANNSSLLFESANSNNNSPDDNIEDKVIEIDEDGNIKKIKPSYDDLLRRRRTLVNPTRVKEEAEAAVREKKLTELLYSDNKKDGSDVNGNEQGGTTPKQQTQVQTLEDIAAANEKKNADQEQDKKKSNSDSTNKKNKDASAASSSWIDKPPVIVPPLRVYGSLSQDDHHQQQEQQEEVVFDKQKKPALVEISIGKPCVPQEVWPCILRQYDANTNVGGVDNNDDEENDS